MTFGTLFPSRNVSDIFFSKVDQDVIRSHHVVHDANISHINTANEYCIEKKSRTNVLL